MRRHDESSSFSQYVRWDFSGKCHYRMKVAVKTSQTEKNPNRKFFGCAKTQVSDFQSNCFGVKKKFKNIITFFLNIPRVVGVIILYELMKYFWN